MTIQFNNLRHLIQNISNLIHDTIWEDQECWVVPTILMVEGVHNGIFYSAEELEKSAPAWNGEPVVVWHPKDGEGKPVSANQPNLLEQRSIGRIFNVHFEDGKLKGDAYLIKSKVTKVSPELRQMIENDMPIEVSTGVFIDEDETAGVWNNETFVKIAYNHKPDHLAFLPGGKGACSWEDGGGAPRINAEDNALKKKESDGHHPASHYLVVEDPKKVSTWHLRVKNVDGTLNHNLMGAAWAALHEGYRGNKYEGPGKTEAINKLKKLYKQENMSLPTNSNNQQQAEMFMNGFKEMIRKLFRISRQEQNEMSDDDKRNLIRKKLLGQKGIGKEVILEVVYSDRIIFSSLDDNGAEHLYRLEYEVDEKNGDVIFKGLPEEVKVEVDYVPVNSEDLQTHNPNKEMNMERKEQVDNLIAAEGSRWMEDEREFLTNLSDDAFERLTKEPETQENKPAEESSKEKTPETNEGTTEEKESKEEVKINLKDLPSEVQRAVQREKEYESKLRDSLKENKRCKLTDEQVDSLDISVLESVAKSIDVEVSYEGILAEENEEKESDDIPTPPALNWDEPTK